MENDRPFVGQFLTRKVAGLAALCGLLAAAPGCVDRAKRADEAMVHYQIAQQLMTKGETTQSLVEAIKAADLDPDNPEITNFLGLLYAQRSDTDKAELWFRKSIKADPDYSNAQNNLCWLLVDKGRVDEGIRHCTKAVENVTYGTPERAYHNMGIAYERKGDLPKAIDAYKKGLIHNKNFVRSLWNLSKIYLGQNSAKEAIPLLEMASRTCLASPKGAWGPDCPEVHYRLAMQYLQMKRREGVVSELKNCVHADDEKGAYGQKCRTNLAMYR